MNNELMIKAQTLLYSNQDRLEALVEALESVCGEGNTKVAPKEKEPYKVSEKDIGSLCYFSDYEDDFDDGTVGLLVSAQETEDLFEDHTELTWRYAKPYTDKIKLHFTPFEASDEDKPPQEAIDHVGRVAVLYKDGDIGILGDASMGRWSSDDLCHIVGYCLLDFVNFVLEE